MIIKAEVGPAPNRIAQRGRFFRLLACTDPVTVQFLDEGWSMTTTIDRGLALTFPQGLDYPTPFDTILISSDKDQPVEFWAGLAVLDDDRLLGSVEVEASVPVQIVGSDSLTTRAVALAANVAKQVAPANASRKSLMLEADADMFVGPVGVALADGFPVRVGESITLDTKAEVWAVCEAVATVRTLSEIANG